MRRGHAEFLRLPEVREEWIADIDESLDTIVDTKNKDVRIDRLSRDLPVWLVTEDLDVESTPRRLLQVSLIRRGGETLLTASIRFRRREGDVVASTTSVPEEHIRHLPLADGLDELPSVLDELWEAKASSKERFVEGEMSWDQVRGLRERLGVET